MQTIQGSLRSLRAALVRAAGAVLRRRGASMADYAVLAGLIAVAVLAAVVLTGEKVRDIFWASNETVLDGIAGLPLSEPPPPGGGMDGDPPPVGQGVWSGDGAFVLSPLEAAQTQILVLTNTGTGVLPIGALGVSGPGATVFQITSTDCEAVLLPGESCIVSVEATATANGTATAILAASGVPGGVSLSLTATGFDPMLVWNGDPTIAVSGTPGPEPLPRTGQTTLTLENQGFADATSVAPAVAGPDADAFQILSSTCPAILPAAASCTVTIRGTASADGVVLATLVSGPDATVQTQLSIEASGFVPLASWSGNPVFAIGAPPSTPATAQQTLTLTNAGTAPVEGIAPSVSGDTAFALVSTTCGATLEPGASCTATVSFTANSDVASVAGLLSGGPGLPSLQLSGTASGIAPALAWSGAPVSLDGTPPQALPVTGQATYTLLNTGNQDATGLGTVSIVGAGWSLVSTTCGATLAQGASCDATLRLEAWTNGAFPGTLSIDGGPSIGVSGSASGFAPAFAWSGDSTFTVSSPTQTPAIVERTFTLTNIGTLAGLPATPTVTGSSSGFTYSLVSHTCDASLAVGGTCQAVVRATFTNNVASASGTLGGPATQALSGSASGFAPVLTWTHNGATMDTAFPPGPVRIYTLTNTGTLASGFLVGTVVLQGTDASAFALDSSCTGALAPGASCQVETRLTGQLLARTYTATLAATSPGGTTTQLSATVDADSTPAAFAFANLMGQAGNTTVSPMPVILTGFNTPISVTATGAGEISTDGGATWGTSRTLSPGQALAVRVATGAPDGGTRSTTITAGGVASVWTVGVVDQIPAAFSFADRTGEELNEIAVSDPTTLTGFNTPTVISVSGTGSPEISVAGGAWTTSTTISPGQTVLVRLTTAATPTTARVATVTAGGVAATWSVTTGGTDSTPNAFTVAALTGQTPGSVAVSSSVLLTGFDAPLTLAVSGQGSPQVSSNGGTTWAPSLRLRPGQSFLVRLTVGDEGETRIATVDAGGVTASWSVGARALDTTPNAFSISALVAQPGTTLVQSSSVTPVGYTDAAPISVSGAGSPQISVAGGPWTTSGTISPGQSFLVRKTSGDPDGLTTTATVTVGGVSADWQVSTIDTMPNPGGPFSITGFMPGTCALSSLITFTGMAQPATFNGATIVSFTGAPAILPSFVRNKVERGVGQTIAAGDQVHLRLCSPTAGMGNPAPATSGLARFNIGGRLYDVNWATAAVDLTPDMVLPTPVANATPGQMVVSDPFVITGVSGAIPIGWDTQFGIGHGNPAGMEFSIDNGVTWSSATLNATGSGGVANGSPNRGILLPQGQPVRLRVVAPAVGQTVLGYIRYGVNNNSNYNGSFSIASPWTVSSSPPDERPDPWRNLSYTSTLAEVGGRIVVSDLVTDPRFASDSRRFGLRIEGINVPVSAVLERISTNSPDIPAFSMTCRDARNLSVQCQDAVVGNTRVMTVTPGMVLQVVVGVPVYAGEVATYRLTIGQRSQTFTITAAAADITPDAFSIPAQAGVQNATVITSDSVIVTGLGARTRIQVSGDGSPQVSVGGRAWTTDTSINPGESFRVRLTSSPQADGTAHTATVSIGVPGAAGQSVLTAPFVVTTADRTPDAISFASVTGVEPGALVESGPATIAGMGVSSYFSVSDGEASVNGGAYAASGTVANGQTVRLRLTAGSHGQTRTATLTVGGLSADFTATARTLDTAPDPFAIPPLTAQPANTLVQSAWITPTGYLDPAPISVSDGEILIDGDTTWRTSATIEPGQRFRVRRTSGAAGATVSATVTIGGVSAIFSVTSGS